MQRMGGLQEPILSTENGITERAQISLELYRYNKLSRTIKIVTF